MAAKGSGRLGQVIATSLNSDGTGIYLLTDTPDVWLLKALDGSLSEQSLSFGDWPPGRSIASYNGNIYLLADDSSQLYKFSPTAAGFTAPTNYFKDETIVNKATVLTIDGSIYLAGGPSGLRRFTAGKLDQTLAPLPEGLQKPSVIYSINNTDRLITLDSQSSNIGLFANNPTAITFQKKLTIKGAKTVDSITTDPRSTTLYALVDGTLISTPLPQ